MCGTANVPVASSRDNYIRIYKLQNFITRKEHIKQLNEQGLVENDTVPGSYLLSLTPLGS